MSSNGFVSGLKDSLDFDDFIEQNLRNPDFMTFGRTHSMEEVKDLWREKRLDQELGDIHEIPIEDALTQIRGSIRENALAGWFRNADSDYKPEIVDSTLSNPGTLNAALNVAYYNYTNFTSNPKSFDSWLKTPQTMYRGTHGQKTIESDVFDAYTPDRSIAEKFGSNISSIKIRPIDTLGSFMTTAEQEFMVPRKRVRR